jgi:transcription elongation factor Elf1
VFKRVKSERTEKQVTPADLKEDVENGALVWGVDPGITDVFTACDSSSDKAERIRRTSSKEYYHLCGYNHAAQERKKHQQDHQDDFKFISKLPSLRTYDLQGFLTASKTRLQNYGRIADYYAKDNWLSKSNFKTYIKKQKATHEIAKRLLYGSKKYHKSSSIGCKQANGDKWVSAHPKDSKNKPKKTIIAFGNGSFSSSMKGKILTSVKRITEAVKKMVKRDSQTEFVYVDEYLTSQICNKCRNAKLSSASINHSKVHAILKCETCSTVWNRDVNAAKNIHYIFQYQSKHNNERPTIFQRRDLDS